MGESVRRQTARLVQCRGHCVEGRFVVLLLLAEGVEISLRAFAATSFEPKRDAPSPLVAAPLLPRSECHRIARLALRSITWPGVIDGRAASPKEKVCLTALALEKPMLVVNYRTIFAWLQPNPKLAPEWLAVDRQKTK